MRRVWQCDTCLDTYPTKPWKCPCCGVETCECCMAGYLICQNCGIDGDGKANYKIAEKAGVDVEYYFGTFEEIFGDTDE